MMQQENGVDGVAQQVPLTMGWAQFGVMYSRFAEGGETKAIREMRSNLARAMAAAEALNAIRATLTEEQLAMVSQTMVSELSKMGY